MPQQRVILSAHKHGSPTTFDAKDLALKFKSDPSREPVLAKERYGRSG